MTTDPLLPWQVHLAERTCGSAAHDHLVDALRNCRYAATAPVGAEHARVRAVHLRALVDAADALAELRAAVRAYRDAEAGWANAYGTMERPVPRRRAEADARLTETREALDALVLMHPCNPFVRVPRG